MAQCHGFLVRIKQSYTCKQHNRAGPMACPLFGDPGFTVVTVAMVLPQHPLLFSLASMIHDFLVFILNIYYVPAQCIKTSNLSLVFHQPSSNSDSYLYSPDYSNSLLRNIPEGVSAHSTPFSTLRCDSGTPVPPETPNMSSPDPNFLRAS